MFRYIAYLIILKETHPLKHDPKFKDSDYILVRIKGNTIYRLFSLYKQKEKIVANIAFNKYLFLASQIGQYATTPHLRFAGNL